MNIWQRMQWRGRPAWKGETEKLELVIIPELGSKIASLRDKAKNREWLEQGERPLGNGGYGSSFTESDLSGWDEMFPTIQTCIYPEGPWQGITLPDHGEVWSIPWRTETADEGLRLTVDGVRLPYRLSKVLSFPAPDTLRLDYRVDNLSGSPLSFLWAAHPLFLVNEGMRLKAPDEVTQAAFTYSQNERLGVFGDTIPWPHTKAANGEAVDLSVIEPRSEDCAEKYYLLEPSGESWASLFDPADGSELTVRFHAADTPYLAIWANYGGFSNGYHLAIEPATGYLDNLAIAMERGEVRTVEAGGTAEWRIEVTIH